MCPNYTHISPAVKPMYASRSLVSLLKTAHKNTYRYFYVLSTGVRSNAPSACGGDGETTRFY